MEKIQKLARMTALALSVIFELMAGPFLGYLIGTYLVKSFGANNLVVSIGVFVGFLVSFYAAMLTIIKIGKFDAKGSTGQKE